MCLLFGSNYNCNQNIRYIRGPMGPAGPQGARGPIGPQGATGPIGLQGPSGTNNILYAQYLGGTVATNSIIPLTFSNATVGSTISVVGNSINLPAGTYLITYSVDGSVPTGDLSTSLYLNGAPIPNEVITQTNTANANSAASKTALITVPAQSTLSLYNTSADTATLTNASITAVKTA